MLVSAKHQGESAISIQYFFKPRILEKRSSLCVGVDFWAGGMRPGVVGLCHHEKGPYNTGKQTAAVERNWVLMLQEGGPLPESESGLLSNTQKWIVWGDTGDDKAREFIGKGCPGGEQRVREPRRPALPHGLQSWVRDNGVSAWLSLILLGPCLFWLRVLPGGKYISQPRCTPVQRILGDWQDILWADIFSLLLVPLRFSQFSGAAPRSLSRPPIVRKLMQVVVIMPIKAGDFGQQVPDTDEVSLSLDFLGPILIDNLLLLKPLRVRPFSAIGILMDIHPTSFLETRVVPEPQPACLRCLLSDLCGSGGLPKSPTLVL